MLPFHVVETFLQHTPTALQDIILELRNIIAAVVPHAAEVIRWGGLSYFHVGRGGIVSAGICQIGIEKNHIQLGFVHGAFLPDPHQLLVGTRKVKRFVRIESFDAAPWEALKELIAASAKFDPHSLLNPPCRKAN